MLSRLFIMAVFWGMFLESYSQAHIYPVMPGVDLNKDFKVSINDGSGFKNVPVQDIVDVCFVHFELNESIDIQIEINQPIEKYRIAPANPNIVSTVAGNKLSFKITKPSKLIVLINKGAGNHHTGLDGLCIFADKPESNPPKLTDENVVNIMDYGVDNSGNLVNTNKIQKSFDEQKGKNKTIYFPPGIYKSGMLHVRDNQSVYLAPGAVLLGSTNMNDYAQLAGEGNQSEKYLIGSWKSDNIKIFGRGIVNGNGTALRTKDPTGSTYKTHNIQFQGSKNVTIEGIISLNASSWSIEPIYCDSLLIDNVKIISDLRLYKNVKNNTDGIDINKCRHVFVNDCLIWTGDDAITPKQDETYEDIFPNRDIYDHNYSNIITYTRKSAIKIGDETWDKAHQFYDMIFQNFDVVLADRVCCIWSRDGALLHQLTFKNFRIEEIYTEYQSHIHCRINQHGNSIKDVSFINFSADKPAPNGSSFIGDNMGNMINGKKVQYANIRFLNYTIGGQKVSGLKDPKAGFKLKDHTVSADSTAFIFDK